MELPAFSHYELEKKILSKWRYINCYLEDEKDLAFEVMEKMKASDTSAEYRIVEIYKKVIQKAD